MNGSPKLSGIINEDKDKFLHLIQLLSRGAIPASGKYLRWGQLAEEAPPEYLMQREWWLALKLQRLLGRQEIGLKDNHGEAFMLGSGEFFAGTIHGLDRPGVDATTVDKALSRNLNDQLSVQALRDEAIASTQLDGIGIDPDAAHQLLRTGRQPSNASEQAVLNMHRVLGHIREIRRQPLTLALLADLHQRITAATTTKVGRAGRLRQASAEAQPPAEELSTRLKAMLTFANGRAPEHFVHPLLRAAALHFWVLHDQPFAEGNGRLARALYYWSVLHVGYPLFESLSLSAIFQHAPAAYQAAFAEVANDENDLLHFVAHVFDAIAKAQRRRAAEMQRLEDELHETVALPNVAKELNPRQNLLVARALKEPGFRRSLQEHARDHNLARQTARNDFAPLVKLGWFEEAKVGRALTFFPVPDLATRLNHIKVD